MLTYLISVTIWILILTTTVRKFMPDLIANGWLDVVELQDRAMRRDPKDVLTTIIVSAIPVFRLILLMVVFYFATHKKEDLF